MLEFDKKFLYVEWDDVLKGKEVIYGDEICEIKEHLEEHKVGEILGKSECACMPFRVKCEDGDAVIFRFAYYDPLLRFKVAKKMGKRVEFRSEGSNREWNTMTDDNIWTQAMEYRIVEEDDSDMITIRQLSMWLAKGNGEFKYRDGENAYMYHSYNEDDSDDKVNKIFVRRWGDEWHEPTVGYCFPEQGEKNG